MKTQETSRAVGCWTNAGLLVVALAAGGCAVATEEPLDAGEIEALEQQWPGGESATDSESANSAADARLPTRAAPENQPRRHSGQLHLQPCYEVDAVCGGGEGICTETSWGLYCVHQNDPNLGIDRWEAEYLDDGDSGEDAR